MVDLKKPVEAGKSIIESMQMMDAISTDELEGDEDAELPKEHPTLPDNHKPSAEKAEPPKEHPTLPDNRKHSAGKAEPLKEDVPGKPLPSKQEAEMPKKHASVPPQLNTSIVKAMEVVVLESLHHLSAQMI